MLTAIQVQSMKNAGLIHADGTLSTRAQNMGYTMQSSPAQVPAATATVTYYLPSGQQLSDVQVQAMKDGGMILPDGSLSAQAQNQGITVSASP